jgi:hypothetical protein
MKIPAKTDDARMNWIAETLYVPVVCDVLD